MIDNPSAPDPRQQVGALLAEAHKAFHDRNRRQAAVSLALAETTAKHHNLHRQAAQFRQALTILAQGGAPKLLARPLPPPPADGLERGRS